MFCNLIHVDLYMCKPVNIGVLSCMFSRFLVSHRLYSGTMTDSYQINYVIMFIIVTLTL